ncbi:MAG: PilZ domain-containing protein [Candidatus Goldiibacteriota bacterium]
MKKPEKESRRHPRYTQILGVSCKVKHFPDDITGEKSKLHTGESFRATTINVSADGMLINCDFLFPERTTITVSVHDKAIDNEKFEILCRIEWTKRNAYKIFGRYAAGLHIIEGSRDKILKLIKHFSE